MEVSQSSTDSTICQSNNQQPPTTSSLTKHSTYLAIQSLLQGLASETRTNEVFPRRLIKAFYRIEEPPSDAILETEVVKRPDTWKRNEDIQQKWRHFLCFDVEATCRSGKEFDWPNEIIVSDARPAVWPLGYRDVGSPDPWTVVSVPLLDVKMHCGSHVMLIVLGIPCGAVPMGLSREPWQHNT